MYDMRENFNRIFRGRPYYEEGVKEAEEKWQAFVAKNKEENLKNSQENDEDDIEGCVGSSGWYFIIELTSIGDEAFICFGKEKIYVGPDDL